MTDVDDRAKLAADADHSVSPSPAGSDRHIDELRMDSESIIFEMTSDGWCATKLTKMGWFRGSAVTIGEAAAALAAQIRAAQAALATR
jgi:Fe2+ transport system protein FeoA